MTPDDLIQRVTGEAARLPQVRALFLGGSYARGSADAYSDVDLIVLVDPQHHADVVVRWRQLLEKISHVVFWNQQGQDAVLLNAITHEWLRCDLLITAPSAFAGRARNLVRPLLDPEGFFDRLPPPLDRKPPDARRVAWLINEFIRVLGLLAVVVGRAEYFVAVSGAGHLRDHLVNLMLEEVSPPDRGGALHLSRVLPAQHMDALCALPFPTPERASVIQAHIAIAREFFPRARVLASNLGVVWPVEFETATRDHLRRALGDGSDISW